MYPHRNLWDILSSESSFRGLSWLEFSMISPKMAENLNQGFFPSARLHEDDTLGLTVLLHKVVHHILSTNVTIVSIRHHLSNGFCSYWSIAPRSAVPCTELFADLFACFLWFTHLLLGLFQAYVRCKLMEPFVKRDSVI